MPSEKVNQQIQWYNSSMLIQNETTMRQLGRSIGHRLQGGELIELIGDVGAGKTTLTKGIAEGLGVSEQVQSPTFTISRVYTAPSGVQLAHYDFYRLSDGGIMADEIHEVLQEPQTAVVIEWAEAIDHVLPEERIKITIRLVANDEEAREVEQSGDTTYSQRIEKGIEDDFTA